MSSDTDSGMPATQPEAQSITILVVEDTILLRTPLAHYLRGVGYTVLEASNAQEALEIVTSGIPVDLVFTDIDMPGRMNGETLARKLAVDDPTLPVILTSGTALGVIDMVGAPRRFIRKPYALDVLESSILEMLASQMKPI